MADMKHPGPWHLNDQGGVITIMDASGREIIATQDGGESVYFADREAERLVLAAPESFALVVETLRDVLPSLRACLPLSWVNEFGARCRRLVTRVLVQPSQPAGRPSYEELAAGLGAALDVLRSVPIELPGVPDLEQDPRAIAGRALLARIEEEPHV